MELRYISSIAWNKSKMLKSDINLRNAIWSVAELKIKIPEDLKRKMEKFGVDWSPEIRRMIEREIQNLTEIERIISKSKMTEENALELGRKISKSIAEKFKKHVIGDWCQRSICRSYSRRRNAQSFVTNKILRKFRFVAPEYLFIEIHEHFEEILEKTKLLQNVAKEASPFTVDPKV